MAWLWSGCEGVISHETALQLHGLSDALPSRIHLTLPTAQQRRRRVVPPLYALHFADLSPPDWSWRGPVPLTSAARTVQDVATAHGDAGLVRQAIGEGLKRGAFTGNEVAAAVRYGEEDLFGFAAPAFAEATAHLGDRYLVHAFSGLCQRPPPADWPTRARALVSAAGGQTLLQGFADRTLMLHTAWPLPGPEPSTIAALRASLAREFQWQG